ncbi:MAG: hypothetical protein LBR60_02170 [Fibrobacter sp.]|jgi:hypothetical protein|nr:hypothetical protein [Fibrobacter sp.]
MIRLNLMDAQVKASSGKTSQVIFETLPSGRKKSGFRLLLTALLVVALGLSLFTGGMMVLGVPAPLMGVLPPEVLSFLGATPEMSVPSSSAVVTGTPTATKRVVGMDSDSLMLVQKTKNGADNLAKDLQPDLFIPKKRTSYATYLPTERLAYQNQVLDQLLTFIGTATPENVSFSDIMYRAPNFYFVRAVAADPTSQKGYLDRLKNVSVKFKTPELPENAPATAITAIGEFADKPVTGAVPAVKFIQESDIAAELELFAKLEPELRYDGFKRKPSVEDFGVYRRFVYRISAHGDFQDVAKLVTALQGSTLRMGVQELELRPTAKQDVEASFQLALLVLPE